MALAAAVSPATTTLSDRARPARVEAALVEGELTWTKARPLCRVANVDDERLWVAFAREKTASALSREVHAVDVGALESGAANTDEDGAPEEEYETIQLRCAGSRRAGSCHRS